MHPWRLRLTNLWNTYKLQSYRPVIPTEVDHTRLHQDLGALLQAPADWIAPLWRDYQALMTTKRHVAELGQVGTLSSEEAFVLHCLSARFQPPELIEIGTHQGKSTRRILDSLASLRLNTRVTCFDIEDLVTCFSRDEATLLLRDVTDSVEEDILDRYAPGIIYLDAHPWRLLKNVIEAVLRREDWLLAIHDCSPILCNPKMTISKDEPGLITMRTGHWERHVLAEVFGLDNPLDPRLNDVETDRHRLRIFGTQHGLGVVLPKALLSA
ncbi:MAG: class I SAM-dependent methyltransferase [Chloroflexi bacterium]|nr:class I SAM-dependent methyltransferase [Chloroflexota bacterium]